MDCLKGSGFIAVHVGAGYHSPANSDMYRDVCRQACLQAVKLLQQRGSALDAVTQAVCVLEDSPCTNAGLGSNLTVEGTVECDASIMDGRTFHYGAVGAMAGVKNPVLVATSLLETQLQGKMSLGRIPPSTLVGPGAFEWATKKNIPTLQKETLVTEGSQRAYLKYKRKLALVEGVANCNGEEHAKHRRVDHTNPETVASTDGLWEEALLGDGAEDRLLDTVGAVAVDWQGHVVSAVSSGGIVLKQPGRLGQAAMYGCGCWAENTDTGAVGISTSGCGEHLTKALLAKECADCLLSQQDPTKALSNVMHHKFLGSRFLQSVKVKLGGVLAVKTDKLPDDQSQVEVMWAHTTDSMCLAFMSTQEDHPQALVSRLPAGSKCGKSCIVQSKVFQLGADQKQSPPTEEDGRQQNPLDGGVKVIVNEGQTAALSVASEAEGTKVNHVS